MKILIIIALLIATLFLLRSQLSAGVRKSLAGVCEEIARLCGLAAVAFFAFVGGMASVALGEKSFDYLVEEVRDRVYRVRETWE